MDLDETRNLSSLDQCPHDLLCEVWEITPKGAQITKMRAQRAFLHVLWWNSEVWLFGQMPTWHSSYLALANGHFKMRLPLSLQTLKSAFLVRFWWNFDLGPLCWSRQARICCKIVEIMTPSYRKLVRKSAKSRHVCVFRKSKFWKIKYLFLSQNRVSRPRYSGPRSKFHQNRSRIVDFRALNDSGRRGAWTFCRSAHAKKSETFSFNVIKWGGFRASQLQKRLKKRHKRIFSHFPTYLHWFLIYWRVWFHWVHF